jgi:uncharacterized membrane protein
MMTSLAGALASVLGGIILDVFSPKNVIAFGSILGIFTIAIYLQIKES